MSQSMSVARAARLVGVSRRQLQQQIAEGSLVSFDGDIEIPELLRLYPDARLEDSAMLDRVERYMQQAVSKTSSDAASHSVLAAKLIATGRELTEVRRRMAAMQALLDQLPADSPALDDWLREARQTLGGAPGQSDIGPDIDAFLLKDHLLTLMSPHVRLLPSGNDFFIDGNETILDAALRSGLSLEYGCSSGTCGQCKVRVVSGEVRKVRAHDYRLATAEMSQQVVLSCCHTAVSDVVLQAGEDEEASDMVSQQIEMRIKSVTQAHEHILVVRAKMPRTQRLRYLAGQWVRLSLADTGATPIAIASCPCDESAVEFHIHRDCHSILWQAFQQARPNDKITIVGPEGENVLRRSSPRSIVFVAIGTGIASAKSLLENAMALDQAERLSLWWISSEADGGFYLHNQCRAWQDALDMFDYHPQPDSGPVYDALPLVIRQQLDERADKEDLDFYVCADGQQADRARVVLLNAGIDARRISAGPFA